MKQAIITIGILTLFFSPVFSETYYEGNNGNSNAAGSSRENNPIITSVPFLVIAPDSRSSGMGETGVATSPDVYSQHWNVAKFAFIENDLGGGISYIPWLKNLGIDDIKILYATGYKRLSSRQTVSGALRYFHLGEINMTNERGDGIGNINPNEWALDAGYSLQLTENLSGGVAFRFIFSDLTQGSGSSISKKGTAGAVDIGFYYQKDMAINGRDGEFAWGINASNLGSKVSYSEDQDGEFIPMNLRLGTRYTYKLDDYNNLTASFDINKYLVPSPEKIDDIDSIPNISSASAIFKSFGDAPGGFTEEMHELMFGIGVEYDYRDQFAVRAGYFHEHETKGNRKYFNVGVGFKLNVLGIDVSYLAARNNSPLAGTVRFSLSFDM